MPNQIKSTDENKEKVIKPMVAPCRIIKINAPFIWLGKGFDDFKKIPILSLGYGIVMMLVSVFITYIAYSAHSIILSISLIGGFFFMGPAIGIGLYSMSRQLNNGIKPELMRCLKEGKKNMGNEMVLAFVFLIVFLIWARAASMIHIFFPSMSSMEMMDWVKFLSIGTAVGAIFATVVFCLGAFSIQMLMDREVDAITAILTSINAVLNNKLVMIVWGMIIVLLILIGIATFFIGFAIVLPIIGHASWHAYREIIDADQWELGPGLN